MIDIYGGEICNIIRISITGNKFLNLGNKNVSTRFENLSRQKNNESLYFIYLLSKRGPHRWPCQQEESINKIPFYYLFAPFHNFQSTRICTKMNNAQFLSHGNKRNFKKFVEQKNSFVTMGQSFGSRVTTLIHIEYEYLFIFSSFRDIPKRRTVNIKAVEGTF